eukprot:107135-Chlamydomonas_euryale.AAC.4
MSAAACTCRAEGKFSALRPPPRENKAPDGNDTRYSFGQHLHAGRRSSRRASHLVAVYERVAGGAEETACEGGGVGAVF